MVMKNSKIKLNEISETLKLKSNTIKKNIKQLKDMEIIERKGSTRDGEWIILNKNI